jgi:ribonuclease R
VYRCFYMIDRIGERFEGTVTAFVGAGAFVNLDEPFVDVMVKVEDLGGDFQIEDDGLMATSGRNGDAIRLGDALLVDVTDVAILRRSIYARRVGAGGHAQKQRGFDPRDGAPRFGHSGNKKKGKKSSWANDQREARGGGGGRAGGRAGEGAGRGGGGGGGRASGRAGEGAGRGGGGARGGEGAGGGRSGAAAGAGAGGGGAGGGGGRDERRGGRKNKGGPGPARDRNAKGGGGGGGGKSTSGGGRKGKGVGKGKGKGGRRR